MEQGEWISQTVPPLGAITSEGIRKQLGRPRLDRLTVLVRESAQNSWDAADPSRTQPVRYSIDLITLSAERLDAWRRVAEGAPDAGSLHLRELLDEESPRLLCVSDRGTTGLGGPTRADEAVSDDHDYVSFVLNVGVPRDKEFGGGTYGFGKTSLFTASRAHTVMVSTKCRVDRQRLESRLVGCALGHSELESGRNLTGRHWWGVPAGDGDAVEPLRDQEADRAARDLGLPGFETKETGTTIAVVAPEFDGRDPEEVAERLVETILVHLWPKMMEGAAGDPEMYFSVSIDGQPLEIPHPRLHPVLRLFCEAWDKQRDPSLSSLLQCRNPVQPLGRLGLARSLSPPPVVSEVALEAGLTAREAGSADPLHHVCLVRGPNLVVRYLEGPPMPDEYVSYAGFFRPLEVLDDVYAHSEPPTHDDWIVSQLEGHGSSTRRSRGSRRPSGPSPRRRNSSPATPRPCRWVRRAISSRALSHAARARAQSTSRGSRQAAAGGVRARSISSGRPIGGARSTKTSSSRTWR
jgi:hypothetical protein